MLILHVILHHVIQLLLIQHSALHHSILLAQSVLMARQLTLSVQQMQLGRPLIHGNVSDHEEQQYHVMHITNPSVSQQQPMDVVVRPEQIQMPDQTSRRGQISLSVAIVHSSTIQHMPSVDESCQHRRDQSLSVSIVQPTVVHQLMVSLV